MVRDDESHKAAQIDQAELFKKDSLVKKINDINNTTGYRVAVLTSNDPTIRKETWENDMRNYVFNTLKNWVIYRDRLETK